MAIGKRESRDKERQTREEPGRETTEIDKVLFFFFFVRVQIA